MSKRKTKKPAGNPYGKGEEKGPSLTLGQLMGQTPAPPPKCPTCNDGGLLTESQRCPVCNCRGCWSDFA